MFDFIAAILTESWLVLGQMGPYLLFGFLAAGMLSVLISREWVERHLGGHGFGPVLKASLFGVPLPLCSCSVIPVSVSMRRHGASRAATTAFLLSTPQTGVDSIAVTYALLGPVFAIFRPLTALLTGLFGGELIRHYGEQNAAVAADGSTPAAGTDVCCAGGHRASIPGRILRYSFVALPRDIGAALLVGILIAGTMAAVIPKDYLALYIGGGVLSILLMMAVGIPLYVCATASVPIAAGFIHMGASPGAALAFLIAGSATNAAGFAAIWKVLGTRSALLYLSTVAGSALGGGLLLNRVIPMTGSSLPQLADHAHALSGGSWSHHVWAVLLLTVLAFSYISKAHPGDDVKNAGKSGGAATVYSHEGGFDIPAGDTCCSHGSR